MRHLPLRRPFLRALLLSGAGFALSLSAQAQEAPAGKPILIVSGKIGLKNQGERAVFDLSRLESLPQKTFTTQTPWEEKPIQFSGPLLRDVLAAVQAQGSQIKAIALNDYKVSIPVADTRRFDMVLALRINGELIPVRSKGPLFIVYPFDSDNELRSSTYYSRSIWQLKAIEVE